MRWFQNYPLSEEFDQCRNMFCRHHAAGPATPSNSIILKFISETAVALLYFNGLL
jgi:hypothetical protein